jgi:integrase
MATVYKRVRPRPGKPELVTWEARWREADGRQRRKTFPKKSDAERFLTGVESGLHTGSYVNPSHGRLTFGPFAEEWLSGRVRLKPKTAAGYRGLLDSRVLPRWAGVPLGRVAYADVAAWVAQLSRELSASRTRQAYFLLTSILDEAVKARRLPANPARGVELPRIPRSERRYLTHDQVQRLADACGEQGMVVLMLAYTGIRWGEMAALRVGRVSPDLQLLHIAEAVADVNGKAVFGPPKSHEDRWVGVPDFLQPGLAERMAGKGPDDLVFTTPRGTPLRVQNWRRDSAFDAAAAAIGLPGLVPHELRHTAASLAIAAGANVINVQKMLGHASAAMTLDRYGHLLDNSMRELAGRMSAARTSSS